MTKKDYELIANSFKTDLNQLHLEVFKSNNDEITACLRERIIAIQRTASNLGERLKQNNHKFDTDKWQNACGILNNPFDPESQAYMLAD